MSNSYKAITESDTTSLIDDSDHLLFNDNGSLKQIQFSDLKAALPEGLTNDIKQALLDCFAHVAWTTADGQDYYDALEEALYPPANLDSISCVYTQSGTVYTTDTLDSLRTDLVVTATYDDSSTATITSYTLSGTLTEGTSTITVSYGEKTTTFNVVVTHLVENYLTSDEALAVFEGYYCNVNKTYNFFQLVSSSSQTAWVVYLPAGTYRLSCYVSGSSTNPNMCSTTMNALAGNTTANILCTSEMDMSNATTSRTSNSTLTYPTTVSARTTSPRIEDGPYAGRYQTYIDITYDRAGYVAISGQTTQGTWTLTEVNHNG